MQASAGNVRDFAFIQLLLQTGIKFAELTRLTISDVELSTPLKAESRTNGYLRISGRERQKARVLPLNYKASLALNAYINSRSAHSNSAVFINRFGEKRSARGVEKLINKYLAQINIINANVQSLRYTFGVHHLHKGTSPKTIQETMGFKDPRSTSRYIALTRELSSRELQQNAL